MKVSGFLVPFPDIGAADLMSDHLELEVQAPGPGQILLTVTLPQTRPTGSEEMTGSNPSYARKKLEIFKREGDDWVQFWSATSDSEGASEEVSLDVASADIPAAGRLLGRVTNMSGINGQFSLECAFIPRQEI